MWYNIFSYNLLLQCIKFGTNLNHYKILKVNQKLPLNTQISVLLILILELYGPISRYTFSWPPCINIPTLLKNNRKNYRPMKSHPSIQDIKLFITCV